MANYQSVEIAGRYPISGPGLDGRYANHARGQYAVAVNLAAGDTIELFDLPPRARIQSGYIKSDAVDTATGVTYNVGISGAYFGQSAQPTLFFSGSTVGRTGGGVDRAVAFAGTDYVTTGKARVILTVGAAPTGGATGGTVIVVLTFINEQPL